MKSHRPLTRVWFFVRLLICAAVFLSNGNAAGPIQGRCLFVQGFLEERLSAGPACLSPVGLCTIAQMFGGLGGEARFTASAFIPSADTPATNVVFVIGNTEVVNARVSGKTGTLLVKNAAAYRSSGDGDLADIQTIIGGTGELSGASGSLRIRGNFLPAEGGRATYEGTVCLP